MARIMAPLSTLVILRVDRAWQPGRPESAPAGPLRVAELGHGGRVELESGTMARSSA
jgi:hypothetical protein